MITLKIYNNVQKQIFKISIRNKKFVFVISTTITITISIFIKTPLITIGSQFAVQAQNV